MEYCEKCIRAMSRSPGGNKKPLDPLTRSLVNTPAEDPKAIALRELAKRELARRHLIPFAKYVMPTYDAGWVHEDIALRLERFFEQMRNKESPRLMINVHPRLGKSLEVSQMFPSWALGHDPTLEFITTSHTLSLAQEFSRKVRSTLEDKPYRALFKDSAVDPENRNVAGWKTTKGGGYRPAGVGGSITGHGAHCFPAGTRVMTQRGSIPIEELVLQPHVALSYDPSTGATSWRRVEACHVRESAGLYEVRTTGGRKFTATGDHKIFVVDRGWVETAKLQVGDSLFALHEVRSGESDRPLSALSYGASQVTHDSVASLTAVGGGPVPVYDLQVEETHCFFAEGVLVHNCLIIDDYLKNKEEALSETTIESLWDWYSSTAYTRLAPGGGVLIIATRWVTNDLSGKLLAMQNEGGDKFETIVYPAIDDRPTYRLPDLSIVYEEQEGAKLLRPAGEALHPARWPVERLMQIKAAVDPMDWEALYQQNPKVAGAGVFKEDEHIHYYDEEELPERLLHYDAWDLAIGRKQRNDYTVGIVGGVDSDDNLWIVDLRRDRFDSLQICDQIIDVHHTHDTQLTGIERSQVAQAIGPFLDKRIEEEKIHSLVVEELPPGNRDKISRARAIQARCKQGKVRIPRNAPWTKAFVEELLMFNGTSSDTQKDDQVDAFSWLGIMLYEMGRPEPGEVVAKEPEWKRKLMRQLRSKRGGGFMAG